MTRFEQYINEGETDEETVENIIATLQKDCKPFLKEKKGRVLYRGTRSYEDIEIKVRRKDRRPSNTPEFISKEIDKLFQKKFGWKPRAQGIFASGDRYATRIYGECHLFFPIGDYRYIWSKEVKDFYRDEYVDDYVLRRDTGVVEDWIKEATGKYQSNDLVGAIKSRSEIMFDVGRYYIVKRKFEDYLKGLK